MKSVKFAQHVIRNYIYDQRKCMRKYRPGQQEFEQFSYSVWAANEILTELMNTPDVPPLYTLELFREKMDDYSCLNKETSYIFSVAKDATENIIDMLIN